MVVPKACQCSNTFWIMNTWLALSRLSRKSAWLLSVRCFCALDDRLMVMFTSRLDPVLIILIPGVFKRGFITFRCNRQIILTLRNLFLCLDLPQEFFLTPNPAVVERIMSWHLDVKIVGSNPPSAGQHSHLAALYWARPSSWKMTLLFH